MFSIQQARLNHPPRTIVLTYYKVTAVTHSISEVERKLRVDEDRLDNLENLKKVQIDTRLKNLPY